MDLKAAYPYLDSAARDVILLGVEERIAWFQKQQLWIPYGSAQAALKLVEEAIERPRSPRMKGYLVIAESNNGKSRLARECASRYPKIDDPSARVSEILCERHTMMLPRSMYATQEEDAGGHAGH